MVHIICQLTIKLLATQAIDEKLQKYLSFVHIGGLSESKR